MLQVMIPVEEIKTDTSKHQVDERSYSLLELDTMESPEWFSIFEKLDGPLTKCLVLVAMMQIEGIVALKECLSMKKYLL